MKFGLVSFDFWYTLIRDPSRAPSTARHDYRVDAFRRALRDDGQRVDSDPIGAVMRAEWARYHAVHLEQRRTLSNRERIADMTERLGCRPLPDALVERLDAELAESLLAAPPQLLSGIAGLLREIAQQATLVLISDTSYSPGRVLRRLLDDAGVLDLFAVTTFSDELGRAKPDPGVFEHTAVAAAFGEGRAVHIGDREVTDVRGAKAAGWDAVLFLGALPEKLRKVDPDTAADVVVDSVADLRDYLFLA